MLIWRETMDRPWVIVGMDAGNPRFPVLFASRGMDAARHGKDDSITRCWEAIPRMGPSL